MAKPSGPESLVFQTENGRFYEIPTDKLPAFEMSEEQVQNFMQEQQSVQTGDVAGYGRGMGMGMPMMQMPMMFMAPTTLARGAPTSMARTAPSAMGRAAPMRSWRRMRRARRG